VSKRGKKLREELALFLKQYARKAQGHGWDPNDRRYDRKIQEMIRRMRPEEFESLLSDEDDE